MKLIRRTFARFLGVAGDSVEVPSGDVCDLDIPEGAWGVELFNKYCACTGPGISDVVGDVSRPCERRRYIFGSHIVSLDTAERRRAATPDGVKVLHPDEVFIPIYYKPDKK